MTTSSKADDLGFMRENKFYFRCWVLWVLICLPIIATSQTIIPRVGLTMSRTSRESNDTNLHDNEIKFRQGFIIGLGYETVISNLLSVQSEISYIQKGQKTEQVSKTSITYSDSRNYLLSYLEVPILLKATVGQGRMKFCPLIGLTISYGISGRANYMLNLENPSTGEVIRYSENYHIEFKENDQQLSDKLYIGTPFDIGLQAGFGVLLFDKFIVDVRYTAGLKGYEYFNNDLDQNRVLQFSVGVPINIKQTKSK